MRCLADQFAEGMTARGPTLTADRNTWTGSLHVVDLPSVIAAREFVGREPYNRAGMFNGHVLRRFENVLGRTMWGFPGNHRDPRFLVIAHFRTPNGEDELPAPGARFSAPMPDECMILHGELSTLEEGKRAGFVLALEAPTRGAVDAILGGGSVDLNETFDFEIHDWECGGRR